jgi:glucose/arabinose dehydrogenase/cytochrome c2
VRSIRFGTWLDERRTRVKLIRTMTLALAALLTLPAVAQGEGLGVARIAEGFDSPLHLADPNDGTGRLFIADQAGLVYVLTGEGDVASEPLLDIGDRLAPRREGLEERGLLGLALHPEFPDKGWVYLHYSAPLRDGAPANWDHTRRVSEFAISADDPDRVNPDSERVLLELDWPTHKHNGGGLAFGPDGYLYVGFGDGGGVHGVGDRPDYRQLEELEDGERWWPEWHHFNELATDLDSWFGKVLRIDVDRGFPGYAVPTDNPLVGEAGRDEVFAWGFRQPYRFAFDPATGDLFVSATSEIAWESIYLVDGPGNYGWPVREGSRCVDIESRSVIDACSDVGPHGEPLRAPVVEYPNLALGAEGVGSAVVGGYVYRGSALPDLHGRLVVADWSAGFSPPAGQLLVADPSDATPWPLEPLLGIEAYVLSLGQDADGELYLLTNEVVGLGEATGKVFKLVPADEASAPRPPASREAAAGDATAGDADDRDAGAGDADADEADPVETDAAAPDAAEPGALGDATGWYTTAQANAGRTAFAEHCASCHETGMGGAGPFPAITGNTFFGRWEGQSGLALFSYIHATMPLGEGGSLSDETYLDVMAHWLRFHAYPAGQQPLEDPQQLAPLELRRP